jgi:uncharacterized protein (DUF427 family)
MPDYPQMIVPVNHVERAPRRVRAFLGGSLVVDTRAALYVWEWPNYPQYYIPLTDVRADLLVDEARESRSTRGTARHFGLRVGEVDRPRAATLFGPDSLPGLDGRVRFEWDHLDAWYEEDEEAFVHPRNPYTRVDPLPSSRHVRVTLDGTLLADSNAPVLLFETGLPTRYYLRPTDVDFDHLRPSDTVTECPYKGRTSRYYSIDTHRGSYLDLAWSYHFPTAACQAIAGLIAFYNERVDIDVDGVRQPRPVTHFF